MIALLSGCGAVDVICGSARPKPIISSISPSSIPFAQVTPSFSLTVNGTKFVGASVVIFNGVAVPTVVNSTLKLTATITAAMIAAPGPYNVSVHTPGGTTGDIGCASGGDSATLVLTVT
jgi:hypothetical protein